MSAVVAPITATETIAFFCELVRKQSAIVLEASKEYLIRARLEPVAKAHGLNSLDELARVVRERLNDAALVTEVVDAMTTNETSFFRDLKPFDLLREQILPELIERRARHRTLRIWCAASSSGQEPYTVAMILRERFPQISDWLIEFVASDISPTMVRRAKEGFFSQLEINRGLPAAYLVKYFTREDAGWRIKPELRRMIDFREVNLIHPWPFSSTFDLVFMRNVLIYFDLAEKRRILGQLRQVLAADGCLFLGTAETTFNVDEKFLRIASGAASCYTLSDEVVKRVSQPGQKE
jgi:chemotaxis protein methyltransferase CheR